MDNQLLKMIESLSLSSGAGRTRAREQLDSWLNSSITLLGDTYKDKLHEIDQLFDNLKENLEGYKQRQTLTLTKQNSDLLQQEIEQLQKQLPTIIEVKNTPGSIYDLQICRTTDVLDTPTVYSTLRRSLLRTIPVQSYRFSSTCRAMACNAKRDEILLYDKDELILYHVNGTLGGSVSWSTMEDGFVSDITWCPILDCFLVLSRMTLSLFNTHLYTYANVKQVRGSQSNHLIALTYVQQDQSVFICCNDSKETIRQYGPLPDWNLKKTWSKENLMQKDDAGIRCIRVNSSGTHLGLVIKNKADQFRVAIYSMDLTQLLMAISPSFSPLKEGPCMDFMLYLTPFINDQWWLLVYGNGIHEHSLLLVDGQTGQSETMITDSILNTCVLDEQYLIVRMKQSMFIYDIQ